MTDTLKSLVEAYLLHVMTQQCELGAMVMIGPVDESQLVPRGMLSSGVIHGICTRALERLDMAIGVSGVFDIAVNVEHSGQVLLTVTRKD